jgi:hypothetical protein
MSPHAQQVPMTPSDLAHVSWFATRERGWWLGWLVCTVAGTAGLCVILTLEADGNASATTYLWPGVVAVIGFLFVQSGFRRWRRYKRDLRGGFKHVWVTQDCQPRMLEMSGQQRQVRRQDFVVDGEHCLIEVSRANELAVSKMRAGVTTRVEVSPHGRLLLSAAPV